jgi:hypothetical protein
MRRFALALGLGLSSGVLAACGGSAGSPGVERTLSAAGSGGETLSPETTSPPAPATPAPAVSTTVAVRPGATTPPAPKATVAAGTARTTEYAPPPPPSGVEPDGYGGYGGVSTVTAAGTTVTLRVYPREQYLGERVQVGLEVAGTTAVRAIRLDLGDGTVVDAPQTHTWSCPTASRPIGASTPAHFYAVPGVYRVTATVTAVPCQILPGPPGGWTGPDGQPAVGMPSPWVPAGPDQVLSVSIPVHQRSDRPPLPVGPPPGP